MRKVAIAAAVLLSVLLPLAALEAASAPSPWVGSWVLDPAKSKTAPNRPTGLTRTYAQADAAMIKYEQSFTTAQGQVVTSSYAGKPDGKPHPVTIGSQQVAQLSFTWKSPTVLHGDVTTANGVQEDLTLEIAKDGKTITEVRRAKSAGSEETLVFRKKS